MRANIHGQFETEDSSLITDNLSPKQTEERVLRRIVLEILPFMQSWAEKKGALAKMAIEQTLKNKSNYESAPAEAWKETLEEFIEKNLELIILKNPLNIRELLLAPEKNPLIKRYLELGENISEEILLIGWHQTHGAIAASFPPITETNRKFPRIKNLILQNILFPTKNENPTKTTGDDKISLWVWDRKNYQIA